MPLHEIDRNSVPEIYGKLLSGRVYPEFFHLPPNSNVVNIGSGNGPQMVMYAGQFADMVGVDVNQERLDRSVGIAADLGITGFTALNANVERTGLESAQYDVVIAIDIVEHVESSEAMLKEARRLLRPGGCLLITFPTLHDKYTELIHKVARLVRRNGTSHDHSHLHGVWNPDFHNNHHSIGDWMAAAEDSGFRLQRSRATIMFPPLHLLGVPRFWFKINWIHAVDSAFCRVPGLKRFGQAMLCVYETR